MREVVPGDAAPLVPSMIALFRAAFRAQVGDSTTAKPDESASLRVSLGSFFWNDGGILPRPRLGAEVYIDPVSSQALIPALILMSGKQAMYSCSHI